MKKQHAFLVLLIVTMAVGIGCQKQKKAAWLPQPPYPGLEVPKTSFTIDNTTDTTLLTSNGTSLFIPNHCFTTSKGDSVVGKVTILYREFHDAIDIFLSGIPMDFTTMNEKRYFRSAGMFDIDAQLNDEKLTIKPGKAIDVHMPSQRAELNYSFFYMNPDKGAWEWVDLPETEVNAEKVEARIKLEAKKSTPNLISDQYFVVNYLGLLDVYLNNDMFKVNRAEKDEALRRKMSEYKFKIYDLTVGGEVRFGNAYYLPSELLWKDVDVKPMPKWLTRFRFSYAKDAKGKWSISNYSISQIRGNLYEVVYKKDGEVFRKKMEAVIPLKNLLKYPASQWQKKYDEEMVVLAEEQKRIDVMAETFRAVSIKMLGVYNFDELLKLDDWIAVKPTFVLDGKSNTTNDVVLFLGDNSGFIHLKAGELEKIQINPPSNHRVLMKMDGNNQIGVFPTDRWKQISADSLRAMELPPFTFNFETRKFNNAIEFRSFLGY